MASSNFEDHAPSSDIRAHMKDLDECTSDILEVISGWIEEDRVTPGEFISCMKKALNQTSTWHKTRLDLIQDTEALISGIGKAPQLLKENGN